MIPCPKNLIHDNDMQAYATRLKELMRSSSLREECGASVRERVEEQFSKSAVLQQWEELFKTL